VNEIQGTYQVAVVDRQNKIEIRPVKVGDQVGGLWIIDGGLRAGEQVVAEGLLKVRQGVTVTTKPFRSQVGSAAQGLPTADGARRTGAMPVAQETPHK
jgi:membrane fusion protein (multidrug efflux system)